MKAEPTTNQLPSQSQEKSIPQPIQPQSIEQPTTKTNDESLDPPKLPELPPDKFESYPKIITQIPSQSDASNKKLIKFLFSLSNLIFFGGSLAGLIVSIYQKHIFPKLKTKTKILGLLYLSASKSYDKISGNLSELIQSNSNSNLYRPPLIKIFLNNAIKIDSIDSNNDQGVEELNPNANQNVEQDQTGSIINAGSTSSNSIDENNTSNPAQVLKDDTLDRSVEIMDSNSPSSISMTSDDQLQTGSDQLEDPNRARFNEPIVKYLKQISMKLKKREELRKGNVELNESIGSEDIIDSKNLETSTTQKNSSSMAIKKLKQSIKAIDDELAHQSQQITFTNQKLSSSHHLYPYGLNHWNTYSASRQSIDNDPYFIALSQFKTQIRELKGVLLNRKKFY